MTAAEYDERLTVIREQIVPYNSKKPQKVTQNGRTDYFGQCIGEVLRSIRKAGIDYLFREEQVFYGKDRGSKGKGTSRRSSASG